jgi:hypothetical protein
MFMGLEIFMYMSAHKQPYDQIVFLWKVTNTHTHIIYTLQLRGKGKFENDPREIEILRFQCLPVKWITCALMIRSVFIL